MVAGKRQVTPSLVDIASSAERLSKLTVSGDHTKPIYSDLARARTAEIATAAATAKATLLMLRFGVRTLRSPTKTYRASLCYRYPPL